MKHQHAIHLTAKGKPLRLQVSEMGELVLASVQFSTALHNANQWIAAAHDGNDLIRETESSYEGSDSALSC